MQRGSTLKEQHRASGFAYVVDGQSRLMNRYPDSAYKPPYWVATPELAIRCPIIIDTIAPISYVVKATCPHVEYDLSVLTLPGGGSWCAQRRLARGVLRRAKSGVLGGNGAVSPVAVFADSVSSPGQRTFLLLSLQREENQT